MLGKVREGVDRLTVFGNKEPVLTVRRVLWAATTGWILAVLYLVPAAIIMATTVVFAPFVLQVWQIGIFALDGGITLEPYVPSMNMSLRSGFWRNPAHPYTIAANIAWAVLLGWQLVIFHLAAALLQALTVIGIPTALTQLQLAAYVIWPFGRELRRRELPTTLADLYLSRMPPTPTQDQARAWV